MNDKKIYYVRIMFWILMFILVSIDSKYWCMVWLAGMYTAIKYAFCINQPKGAQKHRERYYVPSDSVDNINIKNDIKKQNKRSIRILVLWGIFLLVEGSLYHYNIINQDFIILGTISLRIFDKLFVIYWCPFSWIMGNRCCVSCRIYGWDQLMLNSPLIFIPSVTSYSLIFLSMFSFIEW